MFRLLNPAPNVRHAIVPSHMIPWPKIPHRVLHKESRWVRSQESLVRLFSSVAQTEELSKPLHVMRFPPNLPILNRPLVRGNSITAYSDNANKFVNIPKIWLRDNCQCSICVHEVTKQRLLDTFQIPKDIAIKSCVEEDYGIRVSCEWRSVLALSRFDHA